VKEDDDGTLVRRCRDGNRGAFEQLVVRYQRPVYNAALRLLRDAEDARDVAQTTFLKAFEHLADYDPSYKFYSWIYRIAVNEALNTLGRRKPAEAISGEEPDHGPAPSGRSRASRRPVRSRTP
jgi:RNA polymerase sigma-70 factor (ECF subfamily)